MTTHSADLISEPGVGVSEVVLIEPSRKGTRARVASEIKEVVQLVDSGLSMADVVIPRTSPDYIGQLDLFE